MPATTHKYKINQLQSDNTLLTLHPETDAIITLYNPENITFPTAKTINTQPADWAENYNKLYYIVTETSTGSGQWQISTKNTSQTFDTNKRYVKCYLTLAGQHITEVDTALDALTVTINDALNDIATNSGVQAIKVGNTSKKGTVEFIGGGSGLTTVSIPETGIYANKVVINTLLPTNNSVAISSWNSQSRTLAMPDTITLSTTGDLGSTGSTSITFGTAAFTDYTTDKDDITNSTSSSTIKLPSAYAVQQYVEEKITSGAQYLGTVSAATGGNSPHIKFSSAGVGDWCRATTQFGYWDASTGANTEVHVGDILINTNETVSDKTWDVIHTEVDTDTNTQYQAIVGAGSSASGDVYAASIKLNSKELGVDDWTNQDTIKFIEGDNITITPTISTTSSGKSTGKLTISATNTNTWRPIKVNNVNLLNNETSSGNLVFADGQLVKPHYDSEKNVYFDLDSSSIIEPLSATTSGFLRNTYTYTDITLASHTFKPGQVVHWNENLGGYQLLWETPNGWDTLADYSDYKYVSQHLSLDTNSYLTQNQGIKIYSGKKADGTTDIVTATASGTAPILGDSGIVVNEDSTKGTVGVATYSAIMVNRKGIAIVGGNIVEVGTAINGIPSANLAKGGIYYQLIAN